MHKNNAFWIIIISLILLCFIPLGAWAKNKKTSFTLYDPQYYSLKYPSEWKVNQGARHAEFMLPDGNSALIVFSFKTDYSTEKYTEALVKKFVNYRFIESGVTNLDGNPAPKLVYLYPKDDKNYKLLRIYTVERGTLYDIVFTFEEKEFKKQISTINKILESFTIK